MNGSLSVVPDRREAIGATLGGGGAGDVVLIAGKGHETSQQLANRTVPCEDRTVAREMLAQLEC